MGRVSDCQERKRYFFGEGHRTCSCSTSRCKSPKLETELLLTFRSLRDPTSQRSMAMSVLPKCTVYTETKLKLSLLLLFIPSKTPLSNSRLQSPGLTHSRSPSHQDYIPWICSIRDRWKVVGSPSKTCSIWRECRLEVEAGLTSTPTRRGRSRLWLSSIWWIRCVESAM
jgi:hypothetical protein